MKTSSLSEERLSFPLSDDGSEGIASLEGLSNCSRFVSTSRLAPLVSVSSAELPWKTFAAADIIDLLLFPANCPGLSSCCGVAISLSSSVTEPRVSGDSLLRSDTGSLETDVGVVDFDSRAMLPRPAGLFMAFRFA